MVVEPSLKSVCGVRRLYEAPMDRATNSACSLAAVGAGEASMTSRAATVAGTHRASPPTESAWKATAHACVHATSSYRA